MKCLDDGTLQTYLDDELAEEHRRVAAGHLQDCAGCRGRLASIEATMGRVNTWLAALEPVDLPAPDAFVPRIAPAAARLRAGWAALALAGAVAAMAVLFFGNARAPRRLPVPPKPAAPVAAVPAPEFVAVRRVAIRKRVPRHRTEPRLILSDFMAFDDADPMQMGVVVRVMLPVSDASQPGGIQQIAADLAIGEDGRARAIRFVQ